MKTARRKWTCRNCGRRNKTAVGAEGPVQCEYCTEVSGANPTEVPPRQFVDGAGKREVVARLRERYGEALELISPEQPQEARPFAHLAWILGEQRNIDHDEAAFSTAISELVVLWLQDLALELDSDGLAPRARNSDGGVASTANPRQAAAQDLRIATRDFANAFLSSRAGPVREP